MKRIISTCLIMIILTGFFHSGTLAEETVIFDQAVNGSFEEDVSGWRSIKNAVITRVEEGAAGTDGCAQIELFGNMSSIVQDMTITPGTTYTVELYIKTKGIPRTLDVIYLFNDGGWRYLAQSLEVTNRWRKHSMIFTFDGKNHLGTQVDGKGAMEFRVSGGKDALTFYMDEVRILYEKAAVVQQGQYTLNSEPLPERFEGITETFADMDGHWAEAPVGILAKENRIQGVGNDMFLPDQPLSRGEFIQMAISSLNLSHKKYRNVFRDVDAVDWYAPVVQTAYDMGVLGNMVSGEGYLFPDKYILRQEAAYIAAAVAKINGTIGENDIAFADGESISSWAKDNVAAAVACGIVSGYPDGTFKPNQELTRAEGAMILLKLMDFQQRLAIFVDGEKGNDINAGTVSEPVRTIEQALELVKQNNQNMVHNLYVVLLGDEINLEEEIYLDASVSATNGYKIIFTSASDKHTVVSGGKKVDGWQLYDEEKNIYRAYVGTDIQTRQLFVNGVRAIRARTKGGLADATFDGGRIGHTTTEVWLKDLKNIQDVECVYYAAWTNPRIGISDIVVDQGIATLIMDEEAWQRVKTRWYNMQISTPEWLENAYEFIDEGGEWYLSSSDGYLYYKPRFFEDMETAEFIIPVLERLLFIDGSVDAPVTDLVFSGIDFRYSTWLYPNDERGFLDEQNCLIYRGDRHMADGAVEVMNSRRIIFDGCEFAKLGAMALRMSGAIQECDVNGNGFYDISGGAIGLGEPTYKPDVLTTITNPLEDKYLIKNNNITNNFIYGAGQEYKSSVGISVGFAKATNICHNDISNLPYTGITAGYGFKDVEQTATEDVRINNNYVHNILNDLIYDGGAIYVNGRTFGNPDLPGQIKGNYLTRIYNYPGAIYTDIGSDYWQISENVVDLSDTPVWYGYVGRTAPMDAKWYNGHQADQIVLKDNYATTAYHSFETTSTNMDYTDPILFDNVEELDGRAREIVDNSGILPEYIERFPFEEINEFQMPDQIYASSGDLYTPEISGSREKDILRPLPFEELNAQVEVSDSSIAEVTPDNKLKILSSGTCEIQVHIPVFKEMYQTLEATLIVDDVFEDIIIEDGDISINKGHETATNIICMTRFGNTVTPEEVAYRSSDVTVATVTPSGRVTGVGEGSTEIAVSVKVNGSVYEKTFRVTVGNAGTGEAMSVDALDFGKEAFENHQNWVLNVPVRDTLEVLEDRLRFTLPGGMATYGTQLLDKEIYEFDATINGNSTGWPSFTLRSTGKYEAADCYMISFKEGGFDLQRFNQGERTVIYGAVQGFESKAGEKVPWDFKHGQRYHIQYGAINEENGVRIILNIDGVNAINYLDCSTKRLTEKGNIDVYCRNGNIELFYNSNE